MTNTNLPAVFTAKTFAIDMLMVALPFELDARLTRRNLEASNAPLDAALIGQKSAVASATWVLRQMADYANRGSVHLEYRVDKSHTALLNRVLSMVAKGTHYTVLQGVEIIGAAIDAAVKDAAQAAGVAAIAAAKTAKALQDAAAIAAAKDAADRENAAIARQFMAEQMVRGFRAPIAESMAECREQLRGILDASQAVQAAQDAAIAAAITAQAREAETAQAAFIRLASELGVKLMPFQLKKLAA